MFAIKERFPFYDQRRHPCRIIGINFQLEFDERIALTPRGHL